jgi:hypothetical protein
MSEPFDPSGENAIGEALLLFAEMMERLLKIERDYLLVHLSDEEVFVKSTEIAKKVARLDVFRPDEKCSRWGIPEMPLYTRRATDCLVKFYEHHVKLLREQRERLEKAEGGSMIEDADD